MCRAAAGVCDLAETCDGVANTCPADAKSTAVCRAAAGICDVTDSCDGVGDNCPADVLQPNGTSCADGFYCNGAETCQAGSCVDNPDPCVICDEGADICLNEFCGLSPQPSCRTAAKTLLLIKNKDNDGRDKLIWKFIRGQSTSFLDFSDPTSSARYTFCLYAGATETLVQEMSIDPTLGGWGVSGGSKYGYFDPQGLQDGAYKIKLRPSGVNRTKILVKGRGLNLGDPLYRPVLPLPVKAQLVNEQTGICWEGTYNYPFKNNPDLFRADQ